MWEKIKDYNWGHLLSDLIVAILATALTFLLDKLKSLDIQALGASAGGITAVVINNIRRFIC